VIGSEASAPTPESPCHLCGLPLYLYKDALDMGDGTAIHGVCPKRPPRETK
jgi:hypothetical protein